MFWASRSADQLPIVKAIGADESWRALAAWLIIAGGTPSAPIESWGATLRVAPDGTISYPQAG